MLLLDRGNIGKIDTGKGVVALGALLFSAGACDHLAVEYDIDPMCVWVRGEAEAVRKIGSGVCVFHIDRLLGSGDHNGLCRIADQIGKGSGRVSHGVCTVGDHKAVIIFVMFLNGLFNGKPVGGLYVGAVNI